MKLLVFTAPWCGQCKAYHPTVNRFIKLNPGLELEEINVDEKEDAASKYKVQSLPTTVVLGDNGIEITRAVGVLNIPRLTNLIKQ